MEAHLKLTANEKVKFIKERLGKTISEKLAENFDKHKDFIEEKKENDKKEKELYEAQQAERKALQAAEQEKIRLDREKEERAQESLRRIKERKAIKAASEREIRKEKAQEWVHSKKWERIYWERNLEKAIRDCDGKKTNELRNNEPPENVAMNWFDSNFDLKPQFMKYK